MPSFKSFVLAGTLAVAVASPALASSVDVVAAENFYGDLARQVGGSDVTVTSILSNPDQDPHLFEADPSTARALKAAKVVIANGADYDPWMEKLLQADPAPGSRADRGRRPWLARRLATTPTFGMIRTRWRRWPRDLPPACPRSIPPIRPRTASGPLPSRRR